MEHKGYMIVDGALADNTAEIARYIDSLGEEGSDTYSQIAEELRTADDSSQPQDLYFSLAEGSSILLKAPIGEFEPAFNLLVYILSKAPDFDALLPVLLANLSNDTSSNNSQQLAKLAVLGNIFNILPADSSRRYDVYDRVLDFSKATGTLGQLVPQFPKLGDWLRLWGVDVAAKEALFTKIYDLIEPTYPDDARQLLVDANKAGSGPKLAAKLAEVTLEDTTTYDFGKLLSITNVRELEKTNYDLYEVLVFASTGDYSSFAKSSLASNTKISNKIKALALASLAQSSRTLPYASIAKATSVDENEVEVIIIDAIRASLIEGRMDQLNSTLHVERVGIVGDMGIEQWKEIDGWLNDWKKNLVESQVAMKNARSHVDRLQV